MSCLLIDVREAGLSTLRAYESLDMQPAIQYVLSMQLSKLYLIMHLSALLQIPIKIRPSLIKLGHASKRTNLHLDILLKVTNCFCIYALLFRPLISKRINVELGTTHLPRYP